MFNYSLLLGVFYVVIVYCLGLIGYFVLAIKLVSGQIIGRPGDWGNKRLVSIWSA